MTFDSQQNLPPKKLINTRLTTNCVLRWGVQSTPPFYCAKRFSAYLAAFFAAAAKAASCSAICF